MIRERVDELPAAGSAVRKYRISHDATADGQRTPAKYWREEDLAPLALEHDAGSTTPTATEAKATFRPVIPQQVVPSGTQARIRSNLEALRTLRAMREEQRGATAEEQGRLARWSGWGALAVMFDANAADYARFAAEREELAHLLTGEELAAAARSTINAHYTDVTYVECIWDAMRALGFEAGTVLEPGCGSGNFLGFAPPGAQLIGVELDPKTSEIAAALYPHADIRNESFAETRLAEGSVDLVIGNVPFADVTLHDPRHNAGRHRIHNHFILKSLALTRPGGLVAVITSRYTMDALNPSARREIAQVADLVGAVRLPTGAHRRAAGTDVVTDLLIFRRRESEREVGGDRFERSFSLERADEQVLYMRAGAADLDGSKVRINEYFVKHRETHILGELRLVQGEAGRTELGVLGERDARHALQGILSGLVVAARHRGLAYTPIDRPYAGSSVARVADRTLAQPEGYLAVSDGGFVRTEDGQPVPYSPPATQAAELHALLGLRDTALELLEREASSLDDDDDVTALRAQLNSQYDVYATHWGALNRFSLRAGRIDPDTGRPKQVRIQPRQGGFRGDPYASVVYALEVFDDGTQASTKAAIFRERVVARKAPRLGAETVQDAVAICLDTFGELRLSELARLLGRDEVETRRELGELVFDEPQTGRLVPAAEYLSGNVRAKLRQAQEAFSEDARFESNVVALSRVVPRDLGPDEIQAQLGAAWIGRDDVRRFLRELLEEPTLEVEHPMGSLWEVRAKQHGSVLMTSVWGTERVSATQIAQALLEQRPIRVYDLVDETKREFNPQATEEASAKAREMNERFSEWIWEDAGRANRLLKVYNERFNALVPRSYDGVTMALPGLALTFQPRPHQIAAAARIVHEPAVGLFHEVGAGKTSTIAMAAMELRRLGFARKPAVVVPNNMLEQFAREWLQMYPQAKLLAAGSQDLERERRQLFQARCATGDWDAVIMTRGAFERLPMSPQARAEYLEREVIAPLEQALSASGQHSRKRIEKMKMRAQERVKQLLDGQKDAGVSFEMTGIDYVVCDEAHGYKNRARASSNPGLAIEGSQRAQDLDMKMSFLRQRGPRVATLATATPFPNSIAEVYTMTCFLRPDLLRACGIADFDQWVATFGKTTTEVEVAPDGSGLRMQTRLASFQNVPELLQQLHVFADVKTAEDLQLPVPALRTRDADGERVPETVVVPPSAELRAYMFELSLRAELVRARQVEPDDDNMLKISANGRAAGLDLRLIGGATDESQKVHVAAERITAIWAEHRDALFLAQDGKPHPRPGALQLVFCDLGTPHSGQWSVYASLRDGLVCRGMPHEAIRFMHEASTDREKAELFRACRDGRVAVLIGSTERMGVGTNVQKRAVALHHLDCPWRPADIAQREGRILRQGNLNPEVQILRYVTEQSFDGFMWGTVTRKARFISQVMRGRMDVREVEDFGEVALSYNEVKALATGNPLLLDQAKLQSEVQRLERLERAHGNKQRALQGTLRDSAWSLEHWRNVAVAIEQAQQQYRERGGDGFTAKVRGHHVSERTEANDLLRETLADYAQRAPGRKVRIGEVYGFTLLAGPGRLRSDVVLELEEVPRSDITFDARGLATAKPLTRVENLLDGLDNRKTLALLEEARVVRETERAQIEVAKPFRHAVELAEQRAALQRINQELDGSRAVEVTAKTACKTLAALSEEIQTQTQCPVVALPPGRTDGTLLKVERLADTSSVAVVVTGAQAHLVTLPGNLELKTLVGGPISVDSSERGVRLVPGRDFNPPQTPALALPAPPPSCADLTR